MARILLDRLDDDSSAEAVALLAVLGRIWQMADGLLYNDLSRAHFAQSATVSLPLAGEVNLWVFQSRPFPRGEDEITALEESVRTAEELMGVPFPVTDVVLLVPLADHGFGLAAFYGAFITMRRAENESLHWRTMYHEVAHYYLDGGVGPPWLVEGGSEFVADYIWAHTAGREYPMAVKSLAWRWRRIQNCLEQGVENIQQMSELRSRVPELAQCHYYLGSYFLLNLYEAIGKEAIGTTLGEFHLLRQSVGRQATEEEVYQAFLRNTPPEGKELLRDVYRRIHGGVYPEES